VSHGGFNFDSQPRVLRIEVESALFFKGLLGKSSTPTFSRQDVSRTLPPTFANSKASEHTFNQNKPTGSGHVRTAGQQVLVLGRFWIKDWILFIKSDRRQVALLVG